MDDLDSLDYYNGEPVHDMEVDYDYHIMHRGIYGWVLIFFWNADPDRGKPRLPRERIGADFFGRAC